jgi:hypothetical protein
MADPLTQTVEQFAPAPLNIFDQDQAETIISKYSGARRELEDAATAFDANRAVQQAEQDKYRIEQERIRTERDALLATREDEEYAQRKEAEAMRGDLIADMYESLRPQEEGYDKRMVDFLGNAPPSVQNDTVFREVLTGYTRMADKAEEQRRQDREMETRQKNTLEAIQARAKTNTFLSNLKPQDYADAPKDENGNPSLEYLYSKAAERKIENELALTKGKQDIRTDAAKKVLDYRKMDDEQKAEYDQTEKIIINDQGAFPRRVGLVTAKYGAGELEYNSAAKEELRLAKEWDKNLFENEVITAMNAPSAEDYINSDNMENLTPTQKNYRRRVWEYANTYGGKLPPKTSEEASPAGSNAIPLGNADVEDIRTADGKSAPAGSKAIPLGGAPAAPKYTAEQLLKAAPAGSKIVTLPDGTLRIVTPEGKILRTK